MRVCNQELFSMIANLTGATLVQSELNEIIQCVQKHPAVTDDEVREAIDRLKGYKCSLDVEGDDGVKPFKYVDTLIRAATAPKNCDALVKAAQIATGWMEDGEARMDLELALAAHRAQQEGK